MLKTLFSDIKNYGINTAIIHIFDKFFNKNYLNYNLAKNLVMQRKYNKLTSEELVPEIEKAYREKMGENFDIDKVHTFNEKIQWLKAYNSTPLKTLCSDKYEVRSYIKEKAGEKYLVPILGVWNNFDEIDFNKLPQKFVLKATHGSGTNIIVKDKSLLNKKDAKQKIEIWLKMNYAYLMGFELHYRDIKPKIVAEKYIEQIDGNLYDYKIHCFNGNPKFVQLIGDRDFKKHTGKQVFLDLDWKVLPFTTGDYPAFERKINCPKNFENIIELAKKLSENFNYVRVDLYNIDDETILFGELTFTPLSGFYKTWAPTSTNEQWGDMLNLPNLKFILPAKY